jgi:hypothetical protein
MASHGYGETEDRPTTGQTNQRRMQASWRYAVYEMTNPRDFVLHHNDEIMSNFDIVSVAGPDAVGRYLVVVKNTGPVPDPTPIPSP